MQAKKQSVRLIDVAEKAGVSRVAVGKVLLGSGGDRIKVAEDTAKRVREIADELGYSPNRAAQQLSGKPSNLIGVITFLHAPSTEMDRLLQLEREAHERGYQLTIRVLHNPNDEGEMMACLQGFESQGVDGIISLTGERCACAEDAQNRFKVCLYHGCADVIRDLPGIFCNVEAGVRQSVECLFETGRHRIGLASYGNNPYDAVRRKVIKEMTQAQAGAEFVRWAPEEPTGKQQKLGPKHADEVVQYLVRDKSVDAIVTINDYWAGAILKALYRAGVKVPDHVAIIGYCNLELSEFTEPALTTVEEHNDQMAKAYLDLFSERMSGADVLQKNVMPTLVRRGST